MKTLPFWSAAAAPAAATGEDEMRGDRMRGDTGDDRGDTSANAGDTERSKMRVMDCI